MQNFQQIGHIFGQVGLKFHPFFGIRMHETDGSGVQRLTGEGGGCGDLLRLKPCLSSANRRYVFLRAVKRIAD